METQVRENSSRDCQKRMFCVTCSALVQDGSGHDIMHLHLQATLSRLIIQLLCVTSGMNLYACMRCSINDRGTTRL